MSATARIPVRRRSDVVAWATVDADTADNLNQWRWSLNGSGYAMGQPGLMHRVILDLRKGSGQEVDHRNRDKLDNRLANLRLCTHTENVRNSDRYDASEKMRVRIRALWQAGKTRPQIAAALACPYSAVLSTLRGERYADGAHPNVHWSRERLIEFVLAFHGEHGRIPLQRECDGKDGRPWFVTIYKRFGNPRLLVEAAGLEYVDGRRRRAA